MDREYTDTFNDFPGWFRREFLRRRQRNNRYSLRAFAGYLNLSPATVSQLLAGKRRPSAKFIKRLFPHLEATPKEQEFLLLSVKKNKSFDLESSNHDYHLLAKDAVKIVGDWYHYAILELTSVQDFKYDFKWIARQFDISVPEARDAVERLIRAKLLVEKNGELSKSYSFITNYEEGMTNAALKNLQRHVLQRALSAIDEVPGEQKDITSITMAIDETKITEAKKMIKKFRRDLCSYLESGPKKRIYNLAVQLYPLSKESK